MSSPSPMPWIKVYTEVLDDHKFGTLPDALKWRFIEICLLAGECDADGYLVNGDEAMTAIDIAWRLRREPDDLLADLEILSRRGFVILEEDAWLVVNFSKRQGRPQHEKREAWRERKRRQREKEESAEQSETPVELPAENPDERHADVTGDSRARHGSREEESREEKSRMGPAVAGKVSSSSDGRGPPGLTEGQRYWLRSFGAKRFANNVQKEAVRQLEQAHGADKFEEGIRWAAKQGMSMGKAVTSLETALPNWGKPKTKSGEAVTVKGL